MLCVVNESKVETIVQDDVDYWYDRFPVSVRGDDYREGGIPNWRVVSLVALKNHLRMFGLKYLVAQGFSSEVIYIEVFNTVYCS